MTFPPPPPQTRWNPLGPVGTRSNPFRPVETRSDLLKHVPPPPLPPIQKHLETARNYKKDISTDSFDIEILKTKIVKNKKLYFVHWKNYPSSLDSWIEEKYLMSYYVTLPSNGSDLESDHGKLHK